VRTPPCQIRQLPLDCHCGSGGEQTVSKGWVAYLCGPVLSCCRTPVYSTAHAPLPVRHVYCHCTKRDLYTHTPPCKMCQIYMHTPPCKMCQIYMHPPPCKMCQIYMHTPSLPVTYVVNSAASYTKRVYIYTARILQRGVSIHSTETHDSPIAAVGASAPHSAAPPCQVHTPCIRRDSQGGEGRA